MSFSCPNEVFNHGWQWMRGAVSPCFTSMVSVRPLNPGVNATGLRTALRRCDSRAELPLVAASGRWVRVTTINTQHDPWWSFMPNTKLRGINVEEPFCRSPFRVGP